jgi:hypothetical protein
MTGKSEDKLARLFQKIGPQFTEMVEQLRPLATQAIDEFAALQDGEFHVNGMKTAIRLALLREQPELDPAVATGEANKKARWIIFEALVEALYQIEEWTREANPELVERILNDKEVRAYWKVHPEAKLGEVLAALNWPGWQRQ